MTLRTARRLTYVMQGFAAFCSAMVIKTAYLGLQQGMTLLPIINLLTLMLNAYVFVVQAAIRRRIDRVLARLKAAGYEDG